MILVDSSVWIDFFRGLERPWTRWLRERIGTVELATGDLILFEVLQGVRNRRELALVRSRLGLLPVLSLVGPQVAAVAADHARRLRAIGITPRGAIDLLIGTFCILNGCRLLHADRDFEPMVRHLGLPVVELDEPPAGSASGSTAD